ncbi:hypothetical protein HN371_00630 [Candidatus Poribacteria bacterium]|jgi:hypothetical protein|nr:hypothetical protein [Candidatus Poribacteria bacterium]
MWTPVILLAGSAIAPPIPSPDPIPLPAPAWVVQFLLLLTFTLHALAMNVLLGGGIVAALAVARGRKSPGSRIDRLGRGLAKALPYAAATAITTGVAPLLFVQVLYGQFFYSSSILMAVPWLAIVGILTIAYYGLYVNAFRAGADRPMRTRIAWGSSALLVIVGLLYTSNIALMLAPERWADAYAPHGLNPQITLASLARYAHVLVGALAVSGAFVVAYGLFARRTCAEYGSWVVRSGALVVTAATAAQVTFGPAFLFSLPESSRRLFLGADGLATSLVVAGVALAAVAALLLLLAGRPGRGIALPVFGMASLAGGVVAMVLARDVLRRHRLQPYVSEMAVQMQPLVLGLFFVALLATLTTLAWMLIRALRPRTETYSA